MTSDTGFEYSQPHRVTAASWRIPLSVQCLGWLIAAFDLALVAMVSGVTDALYHFVTLQTTVSPLSYLAMGALIFLNFALIGAARGAYRLERLRNLRGQLREVTLAWGASIVVFLGVAFSLKISSDLSRGATLLFFAGGWVALAMFRAAIVHLIRAEQAVRLFAPVGAVVLGEYSELSKVDWCSRLERDGYALHRVVSYISRRGPNDMERAMRETISAGRADGVQAVFVVMPWNAIREIEKICSTLKGLPIPVRLLADHRVSQFLAHGLETIGGAPAAQLQRAPLSKSEQAVKRCMDLAMALAGLVLLFPLLVFTAIAIKLDSPGPVLFWQTRNGFNGRTFRIAKFRSMHVAEDGDVIRQAARGDARLTRLGGWLRKTSIDELPQLWNVLRGDMSVVGPRPHAAAHNREYEQLIASYALRNHVKPGLTGWAQINGFRGATATVDLMRQRVDFDLHYINNWSVWLDLRIIIRTVHLVWRDPAAY